jgi:hypothetical protein
MSAIYRGRPCEPQHRVWLSADAYYNAGGETSIDGVLRTMPPTRCDWARAWARVLWPGGDVVLNAESVSHAYQNCRRVSLTPQAYGGSLSGLATLRLADQDGRAKVILSSMTAFGPIGT